MFRIVICILLLFIYMKTVVNHLHVPRLGKRELIYLLLFTCYYVVSVRRGFLFLWVLGMDYFILLWHSLSLPYNYFVYAKTKAHISGPLRRNRETYQRLRFPYINRTIPLLPRLLTSLYSPVCVVPGRKKGKQVFSRRGSYNVSFACPFVIIYG